MVTVDDKEIESPLLQMLSDGKEHRWKNIVNALADLSPVCFHEA